MSTILHKNSNDIHKGAFIGPIAPTTGSGRRAGVLWVDESTTPPTLRRRDDSDAAWIVIGLVVGSGSTNAAAGNHAHAHTALTGITATQHHDNTNDPSAGQKAALVGTTGTPGSGNKYVTDSDSRLTGGGTPTQIVNDGGSVVISSSGGITATSPAGQDVRLYGPTGESVRAVHGAGAVLNGADQSYVQAQNDNSAAVAGGPGGIAGVFVTALGQTTTTGSGYSGVITSPDNSLDAHGGTSGGAGFNIAPNGDILVKVPFGRNITLRVGTSPSVGSLIRMVGNDLILNASDQAYVSLGHLNDAELTGGPTGSATYAIDVNGRLTLHAASGEQVLLSGLPTSDPSITSALFSQDGVLALSGLDRSRLPTKAAVRVATTTNGTLSTAYANGQVVDGVTLATSDRILLKDQTTGSDNGIWVVNASGAPTRASDANTSAMFFQGFTVFVKAGTTNANRIYLHTTAGATLGSTSLTFVQLGGSGGSGTGIANGGGTLALDGSGNLTGSTPTATQIRLANADGAGLIAASSGDTTIYGASDASVRARQDNGVDILGGPSGSAAIVIAADGTLSINATPTKQVKIILPSTDPSVSNALWNDGGIPVFSGSTAPTGTGAVATDTIWDAAGDLAVGTGANTAAKLTMGTSLQVLRVNAGGTALEYATSSGGSSEVLAATVTLINTNLFALNTTPFTLVAAPGSGLTLVPIKYLFKTNGGTGYDTNGGGSFAFTYAPDTTGGSAFASISDSFISASTATTGWVTPSDQTFLPSPTDQALTVVLSGNALLNDGGSNETLTITTLYRVVTM